MYSSLFTTVLPLLSLVSALPFPSQAEQLVLVSGSTHDVTWNAADQVFDPAATAMDVTIPVDAQPDSDYIAVSMSGSGDWSPQFRLVAPSS